MTKKYHPIQYQRKDETIKVIPADIETILDVGCGDGFITNQLNEKYKVVGMDMNFNDLKYVDKIKVNASSHLIPFKEKTFDLVLGSEIVEHLREPTYIRTLQEFERVSKKYILITVPYCEYLPLDFAKCPKCGCIFHGAGHIRSFPPQGIDNLFSDFSLVLKKGICFIPRKELGTKFEIFIRQNLGGDYFHWSDKCFCPICGTKINKRAKRGFFSYLAAVIRRVQDIFLYGKTPKWLGLLYKKIEKS